MPQKSVAILAVQSDQYITETEHPARRRDLRKDRMDMEKQRLYLAYGSNLNVRQMKFRCPRAATIGTAVIPGYQLLFRGSGTGAYLTIEPRKGGTVPAAVWAVTREDETALDRYEGFPTFYEKFRMELPIRFFKDERTCEKSAFVYIMGWPTDGRPGRPLRQDLYGGLRAFRFRPGGPQTSDRPGQKEAAEMKDEKIGTAVCLLCGRTYRGRPALSRTDGETPICPDCGTRQALESIGVKPEEQAEILETIHRYTDMRQAG